MNLSYSDGFVKIRLFVLFGVILSVLGLLAYLYYGQASPKYESEAISYGDSFVSNINNQEASISYEKLNQDLKVRLATPDSWEIWSSSFKRANVKIESTPYKTEYTGKDESDISYTLSYKTSNESILTIMLTLNNSVWLVEDFRIT